VVAACGDDSTSDTPAVDGGLPTITDGGVPSAADAAIGADTGAGHDHGAAETDAASAAADAGVNPACTVMISLQDYKLVPENPTAKAGTIVLCAKNDGRAPHDLGLRGADMATLQKTRSLGQGESASITLPLSAGAFSIYCSQAGHESLGMKGTLTIE
jgi:plastocyanin